MKRYLISSIFIVAMLFSVGISPAFAQPDEAALNQLSRQPVQHGGRLKPFDSFARETVLAITDKVRFEKNNPTWLVWQWIADGEAWADRPILRVRYEALRKELKLSDDQPRIAPSVLLNNFQFRTLAQEAIQKDRGKQELTALEKKRVDLFNRARHFEAVARATMPGFIPHAKESSAAWLPLETLTDSDLPRLLASIYTPESVSELQASWQALNQVIATEDANLREVVSRFVIAHEKILEQSEVPINRRQIGVEVQYHKTHPFRWAWILYLVGAIICFVSLIRKETYSPGVIIVLMAFLLSTIGFALRCYIAGRPPVTNMYESVVWVSWGATFFALILYYFYRSTWIVIPAAIVSALGLVVADSLPAVLDASLSPLVPVLRSNYWLTIHVLTITLSYGAFALAWGLAHVFLIVSAFQRENTERLKTVGLFMQRALQIGVILLAAGTILGGVWAHYSWGRFWGWDPKETWALIALLVYLAVLHGRYVNWWGAFGTAVGSLFAFFGIIMAWYGVNFVLAAGLHSYGFGGGGFPYVLLVVALDVLITLGLVWKAKH